MPLLCGRFRRSGLIGRTTSHRRSDLRRPLNLTLNGTDPAITGEPSEERLIQPSRPERVGPSSPEVSGAHRGAQAGWYRGARAPARRRPRA
jgi:hypothetical protein